MRKTAKKTSIKTSRKRALPKGASQVLTSLEENVLRMRHGITQTATEPLGTKATTPELQEMLYSIEARAYEMTGQAQVVRQKKTSPKDKIVRALKDKA